MRWDNIQFSTLIKDKATSSLLHTNYTSKDVLKGLSGEISNGELLAILGPTGW
jgi:ABC-type multidrug transport system ATPase subunit